MATAEVLQSFWDQLSHRHNVAQPLCWATATAAHEQQQPYCDAGLWFSFMTFLQLCLKMGQICTLANE